MSALLRRGAPAILVAAALSGCAVGPDYARPEVELPKDLAAPQSASAIADRWWTLFGDPVLDGLVEEALASNRSSVRQQDRLMPAP